MTQTPFESSGMTTWTTLSQEAALIDTLSASERVSVEVLGLSTSGGHPVRLVTVALPTLPEDAPTVLIIGLQHGNEPVGREAALSLLRDLVETTDPDLVAMLGECRFAFIPTANPSGFPDSRNVRGAGGGDMNRNHASLTIRESEYIQRVITRLRPVLTVDCHEWPSQTSSGAWLLGGGNSQGDTTLTALSNNLVDNVRAALTAEGITNRLYPGTMTPRPETLRPAATLRNSAFMLIETPISGHAPASRFATYQVILPAVLAWVQDNLAAVMAAQQDADQTMVARGVARGSFDLGEGASIAELPEGYIMAGPAPKHLEVFGLEHWERGGSVVVPLAQPAFALIPFLLDPVSPLAVVDAQPWDGVLPPAEILPKFSGTPIAARVRLDGIVYEVDKIRVRHGGEIHLVLY